VVTNKYETATSGTKTEEYVISALDINVFGSAAENDKKLATFFNISDYRLESDNLNDCVA
jgi:hypothetical protein